MRVCFQVSHQTDIIGKGRTNDIVQVRIILGRIEKFTAQAFRLSVNGIAAAISDGFFYFLTVMVVLEVAGIFFQIVINYSTILVDQCHA